MACVGGVGGAGGGARPQPRPLGQVTRDADTRAEHREQRQHAPPPATTNRGQTIEILYPGSLLIRCYNKLSPSEVGMANTLL